MGNASIVLVALVGIPIAWGTPASDLNAQLKNAKLDIARCYRVRDLEFAHEDLKIFLNDGYLIFSEPIAGGPFAAVFSSETIEGGDGEVLLSPPRRSERRSLAKFADSPTLDAHFKTALFLFTDNTGRDLMDRAVAQGPPSSEMGALLAGQFTATVRNISQGFEVRLLADLLNGNPKRGFFYATIASPSLGTLDMVYDPTAYEQIVVGQYSTKNDRPMYDVWTSFPARSARLIADAPAGSSNARAESSLESERAPYELANFRIDATVEAGTLNLSAVTRVTLNLKQANLRAIPFEISGQMDVDEVRIDGKPVEVFRQESAREAAFRPSENTMFLVLPPDPLDESKPHEAEIHHHGKVIHTNQGKVFFVSSRTNWYPNQGGAFATYDLTFHYPKTFDLVTTGELVSTSVEGDQRVQHRRSTLPVRFAGFNLGEYQCVERKRSDGFLINVCASRNLDPALRPRPSQPIDTGLGQGAISASRRPIPAVSLPVLTPDPVHKLNKLAAMIDDAFGFMSARLGPPPLHSLTVTPIPAGFGQGFPGLIYLATASYLEPGELPQPVRDAGLASFYNDLLAAHELAHQWWGNLVVAQTYKDNWLQEALANYTALLYLEKRKGPRLVTEVLEDYKRHLIAKGSDGQRIESAGPVTFGTRLSTSRTPYAWQIITYEKGSWILHMLRYEMGDEQFMKLLAEIPKRFARRPLSTEDFRLLAAEFMPPKARDKKLEAFFENWVYTTGIPTLKLSASVSGTRLNGTLLQSGVTKDFEVDVPVEVTSTRGGASPRIYWVRSSSDPVEFSFPVPPGSAHPQIGPAFLQAK
ncbi:MAG TPA: M1 family aminopeptidase [Bryobacteraceae bacterium]|jgi:hypothetical protein